jgi:hypothetical protein
MPGLGCLTPIKGYVNIELRLNRVTHILYLKN